MIVCTDDQILRQVAGSDGSGFLPVFNLEEEIRLAYMGWEDVEKETGLDINKHKGTVKDALSKEVYSAIEQLRKNEKQLKKKKLEIEQTAAFTKAVDEAARKAAEGPVKTTEKLNQKTRKKKSQDQIIFRQKEVNDEEEEHDDGGDTIDSSQKKKQRFDKDKHKHTSASVNYCM